MENTIVLNSGEKIEVLFCDEVSLDIDCGLRYIASGKQEVEQYVNEVSKPTLDAVISNAQADMAEQIAQGVEEASSSAAQSAQSTIDNFVSINKGEIDSYMSTTIIPAMDEKLALVEEYAINTEAHAQEATNQSVQATQKAAEASQSAQSASASAQDAADSAALAIIKSSYGNIGDIKYTTRTDAPNGGAWCDGAEYTKTAFPDIYQMLVDGKINSTDFTRFDESISANGYCDLFGLDTSTSSFKVPKLLAKFVVLSDDELPVKGNGTTIGLQKKELTAGLTTTAGNNADLNWTAAAYGTPEGSAVFGTGPTVGTIGLSSDPTKSGIVAENTTKYAVYRAYVVLYASAAEASVAQAQEFMTVLGGKANVGLDNVTPAQSFKDMSVGWGLPDYTAEISVVSFPYIAPANGWIRVCTSFSNNAAGVSVGGVGFQEACGSSYQGRKMLPVSQGDTISGYAGQQISGALTVYF